MEGSRLRPRSSLQGVSVTNRTIGTKVLCTVLVIALLGVIGLVGCGSASSSASDESWTICLYLCGSNLESRQSWATKTLLEICEASIPANTNVVIQAGGARKWHNEDVKANGDRFVVSDHRLQSVGEASEVSMGETSTFADFLEFCAEEYPADHVAVFLWNHGGGPLRGACYDEVHKRDALSLAELDEGLGKGIQARDGKPYDIVGFDACLMGSLEIAAMFDDDAHWLVGSEELEAGAGWDYGALFDALSQTSDAREISAAICDGYLAKCSERGKDGAATLSAIDLSKVAKVEETLDVALAGLEDEKKNEVQALRHLVFGTRYAQSFGGSTKEEGRSNLVDLKGMAEGNAEGSADGGKAWSNLAQAVDEAVAHRAGGSTMAGANGISLWYPQASNADDLASYVETSPLTSYAQTLSRLYDSVTGEVKFSDAGSVNKDGKLSVTIDPATTDEFFDLYVVNEAVDGSYQDTNVDIDDDWDNLTFAYNPAGAVAITLDGMVLDASVISYEEDYVVFSAPVTVDGEDAYLRIAWIWNFDEPDNGHYELLGVWNGVDHVTGMADRTEDSLPAGSTVGARALHSETVREEVVVGDEVKISETALAPGTYDCYFVALDLKGNEYRSDICTYEVDADGKTKIISIGDKEY